MNFISAQTAHFWLYGFSLLYIYFLSHLFSLLYIYFLSHSVSTLLCLFLYFVVLLASRHDSFKSLTFKRLSSCLIHELKASPASYKFDISWFIFSSVQFSCSVVSDSATPWNAARQASLSIPTPRVHPNPCPLSRWCHPTILSSVVPFSSYPQSFPASGSFQMSQLFASGGQSIEVSASISVLPMNTQDWSPLGWTDWISLQSKGLSRDFSNTIVQKHQFFRA